MKFRPLLAAAGIAATAAILTPAAPASAINCPPFTKIQPIYHPTTGRPVTNICVPDTSPQCYPNCLAVQP